MSGQALICFQTYRLKEGQIHISIKLWTEDRLCVYQIVWKLTSLCGAVVSDSSPQSTFTVVLWAAILQVYFILNCELGKTEMSHYFYFNKCNISPIWMA